MATPSYQTRSELPWILTALVVVLGSWFLYNRYVAELYRPDPSEGGRFTVITYGSDKNPARSEQMAIFDRHYDDQNLRVDLIPGGSDRRSLPTTAAAGRAPYIVDIFAESDVPLYARKGIALPLNSYLKQLRDRADDPFNILTDTWQARLDALRVVNPDWQEGDDPLDRWLWYAVPNNMDIPMVWFNRTLYQQVGQEAGGPMPPEPWLSWTWWDYAALARSMHRRSEATGRFLSFGASALGAGNLYQLYLQICRGRRGENAEAWAALSPSQREALGFAADTGFEEALTVYANPTGPGFLPYPNRDALATAIQFIYDLTHAVAAVPSANDYEQMASAGSGFAGGAFGAFKAGTQGMLIMGRWFVGQVRADCSFDWRLARLPRWVPYEEWARWQAEGKGPGRRDGAWGDDGSQDLRGYANTLGGRLSFLSSSTPEELRPQAFKFLEFLLTNRDFNKTLLIEDGMGANVATARAYLSQPDPLFPEEVERRPAAMELGSLEHLVAKPVWPGNNAYTDKRAIDNGLGTKLARREYLEDAQGAPIDYPAGFDTWFTEEQIEASHEGIGADLAATYTKELEEAWVKGRDRDDVVITYAPTLPTIVGFVAILVFFAGFAAISLRGKEGRA